MPTNANYKQTVTMHQLHVNTLMKRVSNELRKRGSRHDNSKFSGLEASLGDMYHNEYAKINVLTPSKADVDDYVNKTQAATIEHYKLNDHHVEHFEHGLNDMDLIQIIELVCDSLAHLKERGHTDSECVREIERQFINYGASNDIIDVVKNTVKHLCEE